MRFVKMLGLAAVAAAAVMAFVGATSASAAPIDLCLYTTGSPALTAAGCTGVGGTIDTEKTKVTFLAEAKNPILKGSLEETCEKSHSTTTTKGDGTPGIEVTALTFTGNCKPCPTVDTAPPYSGTLIMEDGEYYLKVPGSATLLNCFGIGISCKFTSEAVTLKYIPNFNHDQNEFRAETEELVGPGGLCGTKGAWTANYVVTSPLKFFFFLL